MNITWHDKHITKDPDMLDWYIVWDERNVDTIGIYPNIKAAKDALDEYNDRHFFKRGIA